MGAIKFKQIKMVLYDLIAALFTIVVVIGIAILLILKAVIDVNKKIADMLFGGKYG